MASSFFEPRTAIYFSVVKREEVLLTVVALIFAAALYVELIDPKTHGDEGFHYNQIIRILSGNWRVNPAISMLPTYHYLLAVPGKLYARAGDLPYIRFFAFCLNALSIIVFYQVAKSIELQSAQLRTIQYCFLPILFPFFFLIYTDLFSLAFVLASFHFAREERYGYAGTASFCAVATRQNNILWVLFCVMLILYREKSLIRSIKKAWVFVLLFVAYAIFLWLNHGVAIGRGYQSLGVHTGNIFFMLLLFSILFVPLHIEKAPSIWKLLKEHKESWLLIPLFYLLYIGTFSPTHPDNRSTTELLFFLRNRLLFLMSSSFAWKSIFFLPIAYSVLSLIVIPLKERQFYWIYPASVLFVTPSWLIEQRYYLIPFSLFLLARKQERNCTEYLLLAFYVPVALFLFYGVASGLFFL
jgi:alpha-1,2-glucosyltransferase